MFAFGVSSDSVVPRGILEGSWDLVSKVISRLYLG